MRRRGYRGYRRRVGTSGTVRRAKTRVVSAVFEVDVMRTTQLAPGASTLSNQITQNQILQVWQTNGGGSQAVMYQWAPNLADLASVTTCNYRFISQLYDYVKLHKVKLRLINIVNPRMAVNVSNVGSGTYNFTDWPQQDPVVTATDYDGWQPMQQIGSSGPVVCPNNGDMSELIYNRQGARRHPAWRNLSRTFYPKICVPICDTASGGIGPSCPAAGSANVMQRGAPGYQATFNSPSWLGALLIAFPYLGQVQSGGLINNQTNAVYSIANKYYVSFKSPLYG